MCGTIDPTAKNLVATAMPMRPVAPSLAMIDQVTSHHSRAWAIKRVALNRPEECNAETIAASTAGIDDCASSTELGFLARS
jgi:hypothetical protein